MRWIRWWALIIFGAASTIFTGWWQLDVLEAFQNTTPDPLLNGRFVDPSIPGLLKSIAKDGEIIMMAATGGYTGFVMNAICYLRRLGVSHFVVLALDGAVWEFCKEKKLGVVRASSLGIQKRYGAMAPSLRSKEFNLIAREKHAGVLACLLNGLNVLLLDVDVVLLRDPYEEIWPLSKHHDFVFQSDAKLEDAPNFYMNSGFYYATPSLGSSLVIAHVLEDTHDGQNQEQTVLHLLLCGSSNSNAVDQWECKNTALNASSTVLDRKKFTNGHAVTRAPGSAAVLSWDPYSIHFNWLEGKRNKIQVMQALGMWLVDDKNECIREFHMERSKELAVEFDRLLGL
ncbi:hypothetical protein BSKO_03210 [Bryopsis sp. KO-2023]|nr:hypothetical protein BSKO_03210 [Bryopsis sp. KO-2023]